MSLLLYIQGIGAVGQERQTMDRTKTTPPGAGSPGIATVVVMSRDNAELTYPSLSLEKTDIQNSKNVLLARPIKFAQDGIHIWRNPDGVWEIYSSFNSPVEILATISGERVNGEITLIDSHLKIDRRSPSVIHLSGLTNGEPDFILFKIAGSYVDFDIRNQGSGIRDQIFLGMKGVKPEHVPFRLENRRIPSLEELKKFNPQRTRRESLSREEAQKTEITAGTLNRGKY